MNEAELAALRLLLSEIADELETAKQRSRADALSSSVPASYQAAALGVVCDIQAGRVRRALNLLLGQDS